MLVLIAENRDKGSEIKVREVLSAGEFANVVVYTVNVSQLLASLTSKAQPNRPIRSRQRRANCRRASSGPPLRICKWRWATGSPRSRIFSWPPRVSSRPSRRVHEIHGRARIRLQDSKSLEKDISQLGEELHSQYFLTYFPSTQEESGFHQIVVTVDRPNVKVRTRDGYYWAGKPE